MQTNQISSRTGDNANAQTTTQETDIESQASVSCGQLCREMTTHILARAPMGAVYGVIVGLLVKSGDLLAQQTEENYEPKFTFPFVTGVGAAAGLLTQMTVDLISITVPGWCREETEEELEQIELRDRADANVIRQFMENSSPAIENSHRSAQRTQL